MMTPTKDPLSTGIPNGWPYTEITIRKFIFFKEVIRLPVAWIKQTSAFLAPTILCPKCKEGEGYSETFFFPLTQKNFNKDSLKRIIITCTTCNTKFIGFENNKEIHVITKKGLFIM